MNKDIFVIAEQVDGNISSVSFELIGEACSLAFDLKQEVVAVLIGDGIKDKADQLIKYGADKVIVVDDPILKNYTTEPYAKAIAQLIGEHKPEIVLFAATSIGRDLAPRISARIKTGLTADCTSLCIDPETKLLRMTRPAFGGNLMAVILCKTARPQMATVRPGVMQPNEVDESRKGEVIIKDIQFTADDMNVEVLEVIKKVDKVADISKAKYIVSGGRGIGSAENFEAVKSLAGVLGGEIAGSRAAVDNGWVEKERQVGQTGKTVRPELYIAAGISGAIQHVAGMENSELVIAINSNETAPIFGVADFGVVGDANAIIPPLTEAIKAAKEAGFKYEAPKQDFVGLENVMFEVKGAIAYLTINRQKSLNALNEKTLREIDTVAAKMEELAETVKVLIVRGAGGRAFVAGADISGMQEMTEEEGKEISILAQNAFTRLKNLPQIVIAAINGFALGGGNELNMACDIRIASNRSKFGQPEVNLGLIPGFTGTQKLSRIVGKSAAKQMIFTADMISAEEAYRIGLVNAVVAPESLMRTVNDLAMKILSKSVYAVQEAKKAINNGCDIDISDGLKIENECWTRCFTDEAEGHEGMTAFVEKRKANFKDF